MKTLLLCSLLLSCGLETFAQADGGVYRVKNGSKYAEAIPFADRFQHDSFKDGQVFFRNGRTGRARLNYSLIHGEIMFIGPVNDTLLLTENEYISKILIGDQSYFYQKNNGHIELVGDYGRASLGRKLFLVRLGNERHAAYNQYSETSAIDTYSSFINQNSNFQYLQSSDKLIMKKRNLFFLMDRNHQFHKVSRANLAKIYQGHKREIEQFIESGKYNLEAEDDLRTVLQFCSAL